MHRAGVFSQWGTVKAKTHPLRVIRIGSIKRLQLYSYWMLIGLLTWIINLDADWIT